MAAIEKKRLPTSLNPGFTIQTPAKVLFWSCAARAHQGLARASYEDGTSVVVWRIKN